MMFDFESTSTYWSWLETAIVGSHDSWVVVSRGSRVTRVTRVTGQKVWPIVISDLAGRPENAAFAGHARTSGRTVGKHNANSDSQNWAEGAKQDCRCLIFISGQKWSPIDSFTITRLQNLQHRRRRTEHYNWAHRPHSTPHLPALFSEQ